MMKKATVKTLLVILSGLFLLGACGQKGPLYLEKSEEELAAEAASESNDELTEEQKEEQNDGEAAVKE